MDYPPKFSDGQLQCIVKNTFLELVDRPGDRKRSKSAPADNPLAHAMCSAPKMIDVVAVKMDSPDTSSTHSSLGDEGMLAGFSRTSSKDPEYQEFSDDEPQAPNEVLEALDKLTKLVEDEHYKRENYQHHEATLFLYPYIPTDQRGNISSLGSILHFQGTCKPCAFLKKDRCHKKDLCLYCHLEHDLRTPKARRSKKWRMRTYRQRCLQRQLQREPTESSFATHVSL